MTATDRRRPAAEVLDELSLIDTGYRSVQWNEPNLYEQSRPGIVNDLLPSVEPEIVAAVGDVVAELPAVARRSTPPPLPEVSEPEILRHFIRCSQMTYGYESGSNVGVGTCSMKYSPRVNEVVASLPAIQDLHPLQPEEDMQGLLAIMYRFRDWIRELSGMDEVSFQARGGGHGAFMDACMIRAYHHSRGEDHRDEIITCAVSHPCNPATASAAGFKVISLYPDPVTGATWVSTRFARPSPSGRPA